MQESRRLQRCM
ncbi:hypothetical protein V3C99_005342, partial [Haemonchus contortus]